MRNTTGFYPRLRVDTTTRCSAAGQAGGVLLTDTVRVSGLGAELSTALERWRKPTAVHDPAKIVLDLAVSLALGGDCLADIAVLRAEPEIYGRVASDPTVSRTIDMLAADVSAALKAIDTARAAARSAVWALAGEQAPDSGTDAATPLVVDVDATLVGSHSEKEHAKPTFKRGYGFHKKPAAARLRPEPNLVRHRHHGRRADRLDADARLRRARSPPVGAETAPLPAVHRARRPRPQRPTSLAPPRPEGPLGPTGRRRDQPSPRPRRPQLNNPPPAHPTLTIRNRGTPPTRDDTRAVVTPQEQDQTGTASPPP